MAHRSFCVMEFNPFQMPMDAGPDDMVVGWTELGDPIYQSRFGTKYTAATAATMPSQQAPAPDPLTTTLDSQGRAVHDRQPEENPAKGIVAAMMGVGGEALRGVTAPARAMRGEPVTMGDAWASALDWGALAAPARAPKGALRAGGLRERYAPILRQVADGKDPSRIKLTPERVEAAKEIMARPYNPNLFASQAEYDAFLEAMAAPTRQMNEARHFAESLIRNGEDVRFKMPDGPRGSIYVRVGDRGTVRFADHAQPTEAGRTVGGFSQSLGRRHYPASVSVDPSSGVKLEDVLKRFANLSADDAAETPARQIARLLSEGRAADVTDDMMARADDRELWDLYQSGATGQAMPMDEASRMGRAQGMGFDTDTPLYHGTDADFQAFDMSRAGNTDEGFAGRGVYATNAPDLAEEYGNFLIPKVRNSSRDFVIKNGQTYDDIDSAFGLSGPRDRTGGKSAELTKRMRDSGYSGVVVRDDLAGLPADEFVTFDPRNIRSRFARFDPRLKHLANLSAGAGGVGLMNMLTPEDYENLRIYVENGM